MGRQCAVDQQSAGTAAVVLDDEYPEPGKSRGCGSSKTLAAELTPERRPKLIYVTSKTTAAGMTQTFGQSILRHYLKRNEKGDWVERAGRVSPGEISRQTKTADWASAFPMTEENGDQIVGSSACLREAVDQLGKISSRLPYGFVSGEAGVGKMFLIGALWRQLAPTAGGEARLVVLPCGSFFKDYYVGISHRQFGGGREAVDQLSLIWTMPTGGLLCCVRERLPTAIQEELVARLMPIRRKGMERIRWWASIAASSTT